MTDDVASLKAEVAELRKKGRHRNGMSWIRDAAVVVAVIVPILTYGQAIRSDVNRNSGNIAAQTDRLAIICESIRGSRAVDRVLVGAGGRQFGLLARIVQALQRDRILEGSITFTGIPPRQLNEAVLKLTDDCQPIDLQQLERLLSP